MATEQTPMLKQYWQIKSEIDDKDTILFFRLGDFYEMFFDDAKIASSILDITLTSRNKNDPNPVPLCGIPYHSVDGYISKLLANGKKVAICEQVEPPMTEQSQTEQKIAKGLVKREITKIITPGVLMETESLVSAQNNFLAAIDLVAKEYGRASSATTEVDVVAKLALPELGRASSATTEEDVVAKFTLPKWSLAICDVSTGDFKAGVLKSIHELAQELSRIEPKEILLPRSVSEDQAFLRLKPLLENVMITVLDDTIFSEHLKCNLNVDNISPSAFSVISAVDQYLQTTHKVSMSHIKKILPYTVCEHMIVDESTKRNLELTRTMMDGSHKATLIWLIDQTKTAMGGRTIRRWMLYPLLNPVSIVERLSAVETIKDDFHLSDSLNHDLSLVADIERITSRIVTGSASARELVALKESLKILPQIKDRLNNTVAQTFRSAIPAGLKTCATKLDNGLLINIYEQINPCHELAEKIENVLVNEPPISVRDGGLIKNGISAELDELRGLATDGKSFIARLESSERSRTGISSLKVRYNKVFGYYIEVTHTHAEKIPENYIRKQTLANAERFITPELKEYEEKILGAEERIRQIEFEIFSELREFASTEAGNLADTADAIGRLDAIVSLAHIANQNRYTKPVISTDGEICITAGRHPIIEQLNASERFVPNDINLNKNDCRMMMITGPNMAGKSTIMRQTALIVLMAQMGSFVPADSAKISVVDRIFTRVGASDNLVRGQSTFMVEMSETATILNEATEKSLVLIDEIGRGTSTYDGVSIAWAVAEYLHDTVKAKTLFATHYHELTDLVLTKEGIKNFNVAVKEWNDQIIFLRKLVAGPVNRSYGIHVARLAELPSGVISRAKEILEKLEKGEMALKGNNSKQMSFFD